MYKTVILLILSFLFLVGCEESNSILEPSVQSISKQSSDAPNWISLPSQNTLSKVTDFSVTKLVKRDKDTELIIDESYEGGIHGEVKVIAKIKFYKGTVKENTKVTMTVNVGTGVLSFTPSMEFDKDVELYVKFEGLDLTGVKEKDIDFVYMANDGSIASISYKEILVDESSGTLELKECMVPHFSRYGWTRKK